MATPEELMQQQRMQMLQALLAGRGSNVPPQYAAYLNRPQLSFPAPFTPQVNYSGPSLFDPSAWERLTQSLMGRFNQNFIAPMDKAYNATYGRQPAATPAATGNSALAGLLGLSDADLLALYGGGAGAGDTELDWQKFYLDKEIAGRQADQWLQEFNQRNEQLRAANMISQQEYELNKWQAEQQANQWTQQFQAAQQQQGWENRFAENQFDWQKGQQGWQNNMSQAQWDWQRELEGWNKDFTANQAAQQQENWLRQYGQGQQAQDWQQEQDRWARRFQQSTLDYQKQADEENRKLQKELANMSTFGRRFAPVFSMT